eukprot:263221_1
MLKCQLTLLVAYRTSIMTDHKLNENSPEISHGLPIRSNKCIILDIDGTLIDTLPEQIYKEQKNNLSISRKPDHITDEGDYIWKRPGLDAFIKFCFDNFQHVSIWTAASQEWADVFIRNLIGHQYRDSFTQNGNFVWSRSRLSKQFRMRYFYHYGNDVITHKPLSKVWRSRTRRSEGWNKYNTLIIEDTPRNCVDNYGNAIYVDTYEIIDDTDNSDKCLFNLMKYLAALLQVDTVRCIEKRYWIEIIEFVDKTSDQDLEFQQHVLTQFIKHNVHCIEYTHDVGKSEQTLKEIGINAKCRAKLLQAIQSIK